MATEQHEGHLPSGWEPPRRVSRDEYLRLAEAASERYEYWDGWMYPRLYPPGSHWAMAGGTLPHGRLIVQLLAVLNTHLGDGPCVVYPDDVRLYVDDDAYFYPDAFVTCGGPDDPSLIEQRDAVLVAEVLSPSTAEFDRGDKLERYQRLPGLREYLLLDGRRIHATLYRRTDDGAWVHTVILPEADLVLESIGLRLPLAQVYRGIRMPEVP